MYVDFPLTCVILCLYGKSFFYFNLFFQMMVIFSFFSLFSSIAIVYEVVYRYLYQMPNIKTVADKMLHNRNTAFRHDRFFQKGNLDIRE